VNAVLLVPRLWWIVQGTPVRLGDFGNAFLGPVAVAFSLAAGLAATSLWIKSEPGLARIAIASAGGAVAVGLLCAIWRRPRQELLEVWAHRPRWPILSTRRSSP
jgi:hypothetical protein